jgi:hypothetical protein
VNFFGHAALASWQRPEPSFALGAMLPDLAHMLGRSKVSSSHPVLAEGIAFHHLTDRVFHQSRVFAELESRALRELAEAGVPRGPRRALAHVGLELLLDVELSRVDEWFDHYERALKAVEREGLAAEISWPHSRRLTATPNHPEALSPSDPGLQALCQALLSRAAKLRPSTSADVLERLCRILQPRPRLALPHADRAKVHVWLDRTWPDLVQRVPAWLAELRAGLLFAEPVFAEPLVPQQLAPQLPLPQQLAPQFIPLPRVPAHPVPGLPVLAQCRTTLLSIPGDPA